MEILKTQDVLDAQLDDWRKLAQGLHGRFRTGDFAAGLRFVTAVSAAAEEANHHPDITLTYPLVDVKLITHDAVRPADGDRPEQTFPWVTQLDVDLARRISEIAREQGIEADPTAVAQIEFALDATNLAALGPFWAVLLTGSTDSAQGNDVIDPSGQVPLLWFQETDAHDTPRQRFHLDVWVAHDVAQERIAAAVAAGGTVVDDSEAPAFTVLADAEGNRVCVCTCLAR